MPVFAKWDLGLDEKRYTYIRSMINQYLSSYSALSKQTLILIQLLNFICDYSRAEKARGWDPTMKLNMILIASNANEVIWNVVVILNL